jgi:transcription elongation factor GreB
MSKAFTKESEDAPEVSVMPRPRSPLPPGAKNYITATGEKNLRAELEHLVEVERSRAASITDEEDSKRQLQLVNQRIEQLQDSLQTAVVVPPPAQPWEEVLFGATVTVRDKAGEETRYRLVGVDETDIDRDWVSWCSPIGRALLNARLGQQVRFHVPAGEQQLEIVGITYEE